MFVWFRRLSPFFLLLAVAGCEQQRPPTEEGLKLIRSRTATGTRNTKLEARPQPFPVKTGVSIWDLKVFDLKDKEDGARKEWKFFNQLPQSSNQLNTTDVLMRAWIIADDNSLFLPRVPGYKAYGSFVTDWNIPVAGSYRLFVEYQPAKKNSTSFTEQSTILPLEIAMWDFKVASRDTQSTPASTPTVTALSSQANTIALPVFTESGEKSAYSIQMKTSPLQYAKANNLEWKLQEAGNAAADIVMQETTLLSPDRKKLQHYPTNKISFTPSQKGTWHGWLTFKQENTRYSTPFEFTVN